MRTVIVPLDGSERAERAVPHAAFLARAAGAEVVLLTAVAEPDGATHYLQGIANSTTLAGLTVEVVTSAEHDPATAILREKTRRDAPVVCLSTRGRNALSRAVLGSVAEAVLHHCDVPVVVVGPQCEPPAPDARARLVALCDDGSELAAAALALAAQWATLLDLEPAIVRVHDPSAPEWLAAEEQTLEPVAERAGRLSALSGRSAEAVTLEARHPAEAIVTWATQRRVAWLVLSTHGVSGVDRLLLGSVTAAVAHTSPCPVVALHPRSVGGWWT